VVYSLLFLVNKKTFTTTTTVNHKQGKPQTINKEDKEDKEENETKKKFKNTGSRLELDYYKFYKIPPEHRQ